MMTFPNFLWLIHVLLIVSYIFCIIEYVIKRRKYPQVFKMLHTDFPEQFTRAINEIGKVFGGIFFIHPVVFGMAVEAVPVVVIILIIAAYYCAASVAAVEPVLMKIKNSNTNNQSNNYQDSEETFSGEQVNDDDSFKEQSSQTDKDMPRGVDERDPKHAKLWAIVDDPNANKNERKIALNKILNSS